MRFLRLTLLGAIALLVLATGRAEAGSRTLARDYYERGIRQYNLGEYQSALESFSSAYNEFPDPPLLFNLAQCYRQLHNKQKAITVYRSYLRESEGEPANAAEVRRLIATLEDALAKEHAASGAPPAGTMPPRASEKVDASKPAAAPMPAKLVEDDKPRPAARARSSRLIAGSAVAAVGAAAMISGGALVGLAQQASNDLSRIDRQGGVYDPAEYDRGKTYQGTGIALLAIGGAAAAAGVIVIVLDTRARRAAHVDVATNTLKVSF